MNIIQTINLIMIIEIITDYQWRMKNIFQIIHHNIFPTFHKLELTTMRNPSMIHHMSMKGIFNHIISSKVQEVISKMKMIISIKKKIHNTKKIIWKTTRRKMSTEIILMKVYIKEIYMKRW
ncbi:unnamed protein product [Meganyctiphanes norvegica]|uniref:Uncharacterized protein n=1 Tax=Meganyctiphanes norvegica TaxID=48144 RepID=A0AAV2S2U7_MEGNR